MRFGRLSAIALVLVVASAAASIDWMTASAKDQPPSAANGGELAFQLVESLTTNVGARLAGSPQEAQARDWAVATLQRLKFSRVTVEPFTVRGWERRGEEAEIVSPVRHRLAVTALGGSVATPKKGLTAPIAFVGSFDELIALAPGALTGKIAFVNDRMTATRDGSGYGPAVRKRNKGAIEASKRGAIAVVIRSAGTSINRLPHTGNVDYVADVRKIPAAAVSAPDADQIERLSRQGKPLSMRLALDTRDLGPKLSGNVVADIVGRERPDEIVLLGAHLDSWDLGTGALDDGAGVAVVIAAALQAAGPHLAPRRTIRVVLFGAEEIGGDGGDAYAQTHAAELGKHVVATEYDFGTAPAWGFYTNVPEADLPFFDSIGAALAPLGVERGHNRASGGADVGPLRKAGVRVVSIVQDGTRYFDHHHTANDTLDKIDPKGLAQNVDVYARFAKMVSDW
jgi:Zn-dependent M28 family amino/carboxypeptidase